MWQFIKELRNHTGLGRNSDGTDIASDEWWNSKTKSKLEWKKLKNGWPVYINELEQMFQGVACDGSTSYVPGGTDIEDEEYEEEEASLNVQTPTSSNNNKRASSTNTYASSPSKKSKSKSQAFKLMDKVMTEQTRIADDMNRILERQVELKALMKRRSKEEKKKAEEDEVDLVQQLARDYGVHPRDTRLWYTVL